MAEEITKEGTPTEPTGKYLTRSYLVQSFKDFWKSVKSYLEKVLSEKVDKVNGQGLSTNDFTTAEKTKLDGIAENANNYSHPTDSGNKHIPSGGQSGQILRWASDGTAVWGNDSNTTYSEATTSAAGLMSATDKSKLDNIAEGATQVTVDSNWDPTSKNPAQSKAISAELAKKADIENLRDPSELTDSKSINCRTNAEGHIIFDFPQYTQYVKIHTSFGENFWNPVEKFSIVEGTETIFTTFQTSNSLKSAVIENPEGKYPDGNWKVNASTTFKFYIENLTVDNKKYKPFVVTVQRGNSLNIGTLSVEFSTIS